MVWINAEKLVRDVVVVGASAGGIEAVTELLSRLPSDLPAIVGIVIHRGAQSSSNWSAVLSARTSIRVTEPADLVPLAPRTVYVAPSDKHMRFGTLCVRLDHGDKQHFTRPAVDPLFSSAARAHGRRVVGVVLTGGGKDGSRGLLDITAAGGLSLAQQISEAEVASMPEHAIICDHVDAVLPVRELGDVLVRLVAGQAVELDAP